MRALLSNIVSHKQPPFLRGMRAGGVLAVASAPLVAFDVANSKRGDMASTMVGRSMGLGALPVVSGVASLAVAAIPGIGPLLAPWVGAAVGSASDVYLGNKAIYGFRKLSQGARDTFRLQAGGNFQDTQTARRQRAL